MYYRVAIRIDSAPIWRWESTVLSSISTVIGFLRLYRALPPQHLLVCSSASLEGLQEQLEQENQGLLSQAVTAEHFLQERGMQLPAEVQRLAQWQEGTSLGWVTHSVFSQEEVRVGSGGETVLLSSAVSALERRREELESGPGGDHDLPYRFSLPLSLSQALAWMTLQARMHRGELHP